MQSINCVLVLVEWDQLMISLHSDGIPIIKENNYLNELRNKLYAYLT